MTEELADIRVYTPEETAGILRISLKTLRRLTRDGEIKHRRIGNKYAYTHRQIQEYLERDEANG